MKINIRPMENNQARGFLQLLDYLDKWRVQLIMSP